MADIAAEIEKIESMASAWRGDSFLTRFNNSTSTAPQPCPPEIAEMITFSLKLHQLTDGVFDITVAPLVKKWGFGPDTAQVDAPAIGATQLEVSESPPTLKKNVASIQIDLNAIAKGYAVDKVAALLNATGCPDYLIEIGGELRVTGKIWKVGIEKPDPASVGGISQVIELQNQSIATSGTYRHFRETQNTSHIIDPRTGAPINHGCPAVTVTAPTCMEADAWATALLVLGPVDGAALAESQNTITARFAETMKPLLR